jgi:hypothetical protein
MSEDANRSESELRPHPKCLLTVLDDGTGVILNLDTKYYFTLNETGVALWQALEAGASTASAIAAELVRRFEVDEAQALEDVREVLAELLAEKLVEPAT